MRIKEIHFYPADNCFQKKIVRIFENPRNSLLRSTEFPLRHATACEMFRW